MEYKIYFNICKFIYREIISYDKIKQKWRILLRLFV